MFEKGQDGFPALFLLGLGLVERYSGVSAFWIKRAVVQQVTEPNPISEGFDGIISEEEKPNSDSVRGVLENNGIPYRSLKDTTVEFDTSEERDRALNILKKKIIGDIQEEGDTTLVFGERKAEKRREGGGEIGLDENYNPSNISWGPGVGVRENL